MHATLVTFDIFDIETNAISVQATYAILRNTYFITWKSDAQIRAPFSRQQPRRASLLWPYEYRVWCLSESPSLLDATYQYIAGVNTYYFVNFTADDAGIICHALIHARAQLLFSLLFLLYFFVFDILFHGARGWWWLAAYTAARAYSTSTPHWLLVANFHQPHYAAPHISLSYSGPHLPATVMPPLQLFLLCLGKYIYTGLYLLAVDFANNNVLAIIQTYFSR